MKIAYVVDTKVSALGIAATSRARSNPEISVIEGLNFYTPGSLVSHLRRGKYDLVIFSWRFLAFDLLSFRHLRGPIRRLFRDSSLAVVIPDHLGIDGDLAMKEALLLAEVDYFLVTSQLLFQHYTERYPDKCLGILHDMPNLEEIDVVRASASGISEEIIWVGNSKWGERMGFKDHKRFEEIVKVLISKNYKIKVVDSALRRLSNLNVLQTIRESRYLIHCSKSEGTGLPVLEAAAVGTVPITTGVGIAEEFLVGELSPLLVSPKAEEFETALSWARENFLWLQAKLRDRFDEYVHQSLQENIYFEIDRAGHKIERSIWNEFQSGLKWAVRSLKYRLTKSTH